YLAAVHDIHYPRGSLFRYIHERKLIEDLNLPNAVARYSGLACYSAHDISWSYLRSLPKVYEQTSRIIIAPPSSRTFIKVGIICMLRFLVQVVQRFFLLANMYFDKGRYNILAFVTFLLQSFYHLIISIEFFLVYGFLYFRQELVTLNLDQLFTRWYSLLLYLYFRIFFYITKPVLLLSPNKRE